MNDDSAIRLKLFLKEALQAVEAGRVDGELDAVEGEIALFRKITSPPDAMKALPISTFASEAQKPVPRVLTGITPLDILLDGGLGRGWADWIAAQVAQGKSRILIAVGRHLAKQGIPILIFSGELGGVEIARIAQKDSWGYPIFIREDPISLPELKEEIAIFQGLHPQGVVLLDYVQLYGGEEIPGRSYAVGKVASGLRLLARGFRIPILAAVQLNRGAQTEGVEPGLHNLADSAGLERAADRVVILSLEGEILTARLKKNRWGPVGGEVSMVADLGALTFTEATPERIQDDEVQKLIAIVERFIEEKGPRTVKQISQGTKINGKHPREYLLSVAISHSSRLTLDPAANIVSLKPS